MPIIEIFNFRVSSFLLFVYLGFWAGFAFAWFRLKSKKLPRFFFPKLIVLTLSGAFIGAKTYYLIQHPDWFWEDPFDAFFSLFGSGWFGGFLLCTFLVVLYFRKMCLPVLHFADIIIPAIPLGIIFGRIGCFLAGDGCYGLPTEVPWGMSFPHGAVPTLLTVHPTPLYEALANLVIFMCLIRLNKTALPDGSVLATYLILSSAARFLVEFLRLNPIALWGLTAPQLISLCLLTGGGFILWRVRSVHNNLQESLNHHNRKGKRYANKKISIRGRMHAGKLGRANTAIQDLCAN